MEGKKLTKLQVDIHKWVKEHPGRTPEDLKEWAIETGKEISEVLGAVYDMIFNLNIRYNDKTNALTAKELPNE